MTALKIVQKYFPEVKSVTDAKDPMTVEVTKAHNNSAAVRNHKSCAMAVACRKKTDADGVIVSVTKCYVIFGTRAVRYRLGEAVSREIVSFDRDAGFAPGEYQILPPEPSLRIGANHGSNSKGNGTKKIRRSHHTTGIRTVLGSREE